MLRADDHRHGTYAGARAHWGEGSPLCGGCKRAANIKRQTNRLRSIEGLPRMVPALGYVRRLQALCAIGYGYPTLAAETGINERTLRHLTIRQWVYRETADRIATTYDRLCMSRPEGQYATRTRNVATKNGWPPPLAWDDIDDENEQPTDWRYIPPTRAELLTELDHRHAGISEACRVLKVSRDALERWAERHGHRQVVSRLIAREQPDYERLATNRKAS